MAFEWLDRFQRQQEKDPRYAEKTLAAYRLGMKGKGALVGVEVKAGAGCCEAAARLEPGRVYHPASAPTLPLPACNRGRACPCVYRPVMAYQAGAAAPEEAPAAEPVADLAEGT